MASEAEIRLSTSTSRSLLINSIVKNSLAKSLNIKNSKINHLKLKEIRYFNTSSSLCNTEDTPKKAKKPMIVFYLCIYIYICIKN